MRLKGESPSLEVRDKCPVHKLEIGSKCLKGNEMVLETRCPPHVNLDKHSSSVPAKKLKGS